MDIRLYTLDFSDMRILPASSKENGYISMNTEREFRGSGSFELVFRDEEVEDFIREHPEGLLVVWGSFQGYLTDYQFKEKEKWAFGSHLNSLLHKFVIPDQNIVDLDLQEVVRILIESKTPFIYVDSAEGFGKISFTTDTSYQYLDSFLISLTEKAKIGYHLFIKDRQIYFELLKAETNPLMLSKNNLNVYEAQEDFSNKTVAYGGWYKKTEENDGTKVENPSWVYITTEQKEGVYTQDVVLKASSPGEAAEELATYCSTLDTTCKTKNIAYGEDYKLGDVVRYQAKNKTVQKQITKISIWHEKSSYHEEPTLTKWEEKDVQS